MPKHGMFETEGGQPFSGEIPDGAPFTLTASNAGFSGKKFVISIHVKFELNSPVSCYAFGILNLNSGHMVFGV